MSKRKPSPDARHHAKRSTRYWRDLRNPAEYASASEQVRRLRNKGYSLKRIQEDTRIHPAAVRSMLGVPIRPSMNPGPKPTASHETQQRRWREAVEEFGPQRVRFEDAPLIERAVGRPPLMQTIALRKDVA